MSMIAKKASLPFVFGILLLGFFSCSKEIASEDISFPKEAQLVKGQKCILKCAVMRNEIDGNTIIVNGGSFVSNMTHIDDTTVLGVQNGTIVALSKGKCFVKGTVNAKTGQHDARCLIEVREPLPMPNPFDTVFAHDGDTVCFPKFETTETHVFNVECESVGQNHIGKDDWGIQWGKIELVWLRHFDTLFWSSSYLTHSVSAQVHEGDTAIRICCDSLSMSVRIPVVILHDEKDKDQNDN